MLRLLSKRSSSCGTGGVIVGTTADGVAPAGTGVASIGGAARAGAVPPGGAGGDGRVGQDSNLREHSQLRLGDPFAFRPQVGADGPHSCRGSIAWLQTKVIAK